MDSSEFVDAVPVPTYGEGLPLDNPWVWVTALLLGLLILWLGWHFGSGRAEEENRQRQRQVIDAIYKAINDKARIAAAAPRGKAVSAAHDLADEIRALLGPVVDLTPFGRRAVALERALAGRPVSRDHDDPEPAAANHGGSGHGAHGSGHGSGHGDSHGAHPATAHSPPAAAGANINISIGGHGAEGGHGAHGGHAPPLDAVRTAVMDICDYWSRSTMKAELGAAQQALLKMPPPPPFKPIKPASGH